MRSLKEFSPLIFKKMKEHKEKIYPESKAVLPENERILGGPVPARFRNTKYHDEIKKIIDKVNKAEKVKQAKKIKKK